MQKQAKTPDMASKNLNDRVRGSRLGEQHPRLMFRAQRLFTIGHNWYFSTREGENQGPFSSKRIAELALEIYIKKVSK